MKTTTVKIIDAAMCPHCNKRCGQMVVPAKKHCCPPEKFTPMICINPGCQMPYWIDFVAIGAPLLAPF